MPIYYRLTRKQLANSTNPQVQAIRQRDWKLTGILDNTTGTVRYGNDEQRYAAFYRENVEAPLLRYNGAYVVESKTKQCLFNNASPAANKHDIDAYLKTIIPDAAKRQAFMQYFDAGIIDANVIDGFTKYARGQGALGGAKSGNYEGNVFCDNDEVIIVSKVSAIEVFDSDANTEALDGDVFAVSRLTEAGFELEEYICTAPALAQKLMAHDTASANALRVEDYALDEAPSPVTRYHASLLGTKKRLLQSLVKLLQSVGNCDDSARLCLALNHLLAADATALEPASAKSVRAWVNALVILQPLKAKNDSVLPSDIIRQCLEAVEHIKVINDMPGEVVNALNGAVLALLQRHNIKRRLATAIALQVNSPTRVEVEKALLRNVSVLWDNQEAQAPPLTPEAKLRLYQLLLSSATDSDDKIMASMGERQANLVELSDARHNINADLLLALRVYLNYRYLTCAKAPSNNASMQQVFNKNSVQAAVNNALPKRPVLHLSVAEWERALHKVLAALAQCVAQHSDAIHDAAIKAQVNRMVDDTYARLRARYNAARTALSQHNAREARLYIGLARELGRACDADVDFNNDTLKKHPQAAHDLVCLLEGTNAIITDPHNLDTVQTNAQLISQLGSRHMGKIIAGSVLIVTAAILVTACILSATVSFGASIAVLGVVGEFLASNALIAGISCAVAGVLSFGVFGGAGSFLCHTGRQKRLTAFNETTKKAYACLDAIQGRKSRYPKLTDRTSPVAPAAPNPIAATQLVATGASSSSSSRSSVRRPVMPVTCR